jgi:DNA-binding SARP family transcriptional activator/tetratricopeptide (TPR) repeat protein
VSIGLLGTLELVDEHGRTVDIGGVQPRVVLALLVAADGRIVSTDTLVDVIWPDQMPVSASGTLQTYVSRLRKALAAVGASIVREPAGYRLEVERDQVDLYRFEALADAGRAALDGGDAATARTLLTEAADLWRGPAVPEIRDRQQIAGFVRRLDERRLAVLEDRFAADLMLGRHAAVVGELAQSVDEHPLREGLWELLALARYRAGQQADALRAISDARRTLVEELGVEPGPRLRELESAILAHDRSLDLDVTPSRTVGDGSAGGTTPAGDRSNVGRTAAPMVGRRDELARLVSVLDDVLAGETCVAVVQGEAGVGKTRLVDALAGEAARRGAAIAVGRSLEGGAAPAYWPWLGVLRSLQAAHPDRADVAIGQLLDATGSLPAAPVATDRSHLLDGTIGLLDPRPVAPALVVVLEDVQWADPGSLELLSQVIGGLGPSAVLLVLTLREGDDADRPAVVSVLAEASRRSGTVRIRLDGLDLSEVSELLAHLHGGTVDPAAAAVMHERAEGNPFFTIELIRLLESTGAADRVVGASSLADRAVPDSVRDVVRQRLARLPASTIELLRLAAVAGRDLDVELLARASGRTFDACLDDLDVAMVHRILVPADDGAGLRFAHALVREVMVDDLTALRRARAHLLVADAIASVGRGTDEAEIYAEHLWAAAPIGVGRRAADALDTAAEVAIGRFAVATAAGLLTRSLELRRAAGSDLEAAAAELDTITNLVWTQRALHGYQGGMDYYQRAAELARRLDRREVELEMVWAEWAAHDTSCDFDRARPVAEQIAALGRESDDPLVQLAGATTWAIQCWHDGDLRGSFEAFARAAEASSAIDPVDNDLSFIAELLVLSTSFRLYIAEQVGELTEPESAFAEAAAAAPGNFPKAMTWCFGCTSATSAGDPERVERCARRVMEAEAGQVLGFWGSQARMYLSSVLVAAGRVEEGRKLFGAGLEAYREAGMRTGLALIVAAAVSAEVVGGDVGRAEQLLRIAQDELEVGERYAIPIVMLAAADVAEALGADEDDVRRQRAEAEEIALEQGAVVVAARARAARSGESWAGWVAGGRHQSTDSMSSPSSA